MAPIPTRHLLVFVVLALVARLALGYATYALQSFKETPNGVDARASLESGSGPYGNDIHNIRLQAFYETENVMRLKLTDADKPRWEVPGVVLRDPPAVMPKKRNYALQVMTKPFGFIVRRESDRAVIFNSTRSNFAFSDQYLEITNQLPRSVVEKGHNLYGLGENIHKFKLENRIYTLWNRDHFASNTPVNLYGTHPFYMELRDGVSHGVFLLNTNGMDVVVNKDSIQYRVIGGVLDFWFFMGGTPEETILQYHDLIGKPHMPAYWSLGFMQCRWGYKSIAETEQVVDNFKKYQIPLDVMYNDIDYMDGYKDFTVDPTRFALHDMQNFITKLHKNNQRYVVIVDPGIKIEKGYEPYEAGLAQNIFINANNGKPLVNRVWPGLTHFPDFTNLRSHDYWYYFIDKFMKDVPIDGIWIDMNEVAGFCDGECPTDQPQQRDKSKFDPRKPPYVPFHSGGLETHTLSMDAVMNASIYYNAHDLYGMLEAVATTNALKKVTNKRPFVLTRSTYAGTGRYCAHWLGDNESTFQSMYESLPGILNMNLFGINHVGADICGFAGDSTEELCARWMQLGSFYPFSRNHNSIGRKPQEPYVFGERVTNISRNVLLNRYSLLPYYYTLFYENHVAGGTLVKPLFFEFPLDESCYDIDQQFLIGAALLVTPVLKQGQTRVSGYFPRGSVWYDFYSGKKMSVSEGGQWLDLDAPLETINVHMRGGYVIPRQTPGLTTAETRKQPMQLLIALNSTYSAIGSLYLDDGESLDTIEQQRYTEIKYVVATTGQQQSTTLFSVFMHNKYEGVNGLKMDKITVYGSAGKVCQVQSKGQQLTFNYNDQSNVLDIFTDFALSQTLDVTWTYCQSSVKP